MILITTFCLAVYTDSLVHLLVSMEINYIPEAVLLGNQLGHMRRSKDMTQEELAEVIDVSVGWLSRIERGVELPNVKRLFQIAKALRVEVKDLLPP
jgi:DNA-binding XRE family transcriptional regulator